ncbi:MAG: fibrobacter succinogenes major paralogous domain-containing protein [Marinilabiliales bacterium]|nr:fibrobacter succinogenes major paralogous domain-containing protein [Marinilabiliales bacterium]
MRANVELYGRLYTWFAITDPRGVCPTGWHVPSYAEWITLQDYLIANGYNYDATATTGNKIAKVDGFPYQLVLHQPPRVRLSAILTYPCQAQCLRFRERFTQDTVDRRGI